MYNCICLYIINVDSYTNAQVDRKTDRQIQKRIKQNIRLNITKWCTSKSWIISFAIIFEVQILSLEICVPSWAQWHLITRPCTWWVLNHWSDMNHWSDLISPAFPLLVAVKRTRRRGCPSLPAKQNVSVREKTHTQNSLLSCNPRFDKDKQKCILRIPSNPNLEYICKYMD